MIVPIDGHVLREPISIGVAGFGAQSTGLGTFFTDPVMIARLQAVFERDFSTPGQSLAAQACTPKELFMFKPLIATAFAACLMLPAAYAQDAKVTMRARVSENSKAQTHSPSISWSPVAPIQEPVSPNTSESNDELSFDISRNKTSLCSQKNSWWCTWHKG